MRKTKTETLDEWAVRAIAEEQAHARAAIARGEPVDSVIEQMALRIQKKLLHPLYAVLKQDVAVVDLVESKKSYDRVYLSHRRADQR